MTFHARINTAFQEENNRRKAEGSPRLTKTDLWKAAGVSSSAATFWFDGTNGADLDTCVKIAPLLRISPAWLFDGTPPKNPAPAAERDYVDEEHAPVRMVDAKASAGKGTIVFSDDAKKVLMFRRDYLAKNDAKPEDALAFTVDGDSMVDMHIPHGSVVIANRKKREPVSRRVYVLWIDDELCVKQVIKADGRWWARSHNQAKSDEYPDLPIEHGDRIVGQAFWCGFDL